MGMNVRRFGAVGLMTLSLAVGTTACSTDTNDTNDGPVVPSTTVPGGVAPADTTDTTRADELFR